MKPIRFALLWHQHQPCYRSGTEFKMPWTWLHATKDYLEMAEHFERHPEMKGTINLVPSLLKQLQEYLTGDGLDPIVQLMSKPTAGLTKKEKSCMLERFFDANRERVVERSPRYAELFQKAQEQNASAIFEAQDYLDLAIHFSLAWTGEIAKQREPFASLVLKERNYTEAEKQSLMQAQYENVRKIIPLHKKLLEQKQIELTTTPFYHPILPLLCDTNVAREAMPDVALPQNRFRAPEEADHQLARARQFFQEEVGIVPRGMWPSEGSISKEALALIRKNGFAWVASDEAVLANALNGKSVQAGMFDIRPEHARFFPWRVETPNGKIALFFRDHGLSDDIGFRYSSWDAIQAVDHFAQNVLNIRSTLLEAYGEDVLKMACVPVILDGENCWEYFPKNGFAFLDELYTRLTSISEISPVTFSEVLSGCDENKLPFLPDLVAGSWINANFRIWIGHEEDNASWDALYAAKEAFDRSKEDAMTLTGSAQEKALANIRAAHEELMIAEGSDWNWWYGDENFSAHRDLFDELYRSHLRNVYEALKLPVPKDLSKPIVGRFSTEGSEKQKSGAMHRATN